MGCVMSRRYAELCEESRVLRAKIHALEEEITEMRRRREQEARAHEQREAAFAAKEGEWKRERRRHREEAGAMKKKLEEEGRRRALEEVAAAAAGGAGDSVEEGLQRLSACRLVEQMKAEQARRDQAVEKWKQLYLVIKAELDALILRTKQGETLCWVAEGEVMERLQRELKAKEEVVEALRSRLAAMEMEGARRDREIDILRQSLKILSSKTRSRGRKNLVRGLRS